MVAVPGLTKCAGGAYDRATDPWVSVRAQRGRLPARARLQRCRLRPTRAAREQVHRRRRQPGGSAVRDRRDLDANVFNDKQTITADSTNANLVYAVWDRLVFPSSERASVRAGFRSSAFRGPVWFARTTNGGATLGAGPRDLRPGAERPDDRQPDRRAARTERSSTSSTRSTTTTRRSSVASSVRVMRSTEQGRHVVGRRSSIDQLRTIGVTDPETGDAVRTGDIIPDVAVGPNGDLYAVWQDARVNGGGADGVALSRSTDGGLTWSPRIKVNQTPTNIPIGNQQAFTPSVDVAADGTVAVTYYDFRNNTGAAPLLTDYCGRPLPRGMQQRCQLGRRGRGSRTRRSTCARRRSRAASSPATTKGSRRQGTTSARSSARRTAPIPEAPSSAASARRRYGTCLPGAQRAGQARPTPVSALVAHGLRASRLGSSAWTVAPPRPVIVSAARSALTIASSVASIAA